MNGVVTRWGTNGYGMPGLGILGPAAEAVASGGFRGCALVNGDVLCWGDNDDGQLGNGSTDPTTTFVPSAVGPWASEGRHRASNTRNHFTDGERPLPEQLRAHGNDPRDDIGAAGVSVYDTRK